MPNRDFWALDRAAVLDDAADRFAKLGDQDRATRCRTIAAGLRRSVGDGS